MRTATTLAAAVFMTAALALTGCSGSDDPDPPAIASPTLVTSNPTPIRSSAAPRTPEPPTLDGDGAAQLYIDWRDTVYALPPTQPEAVDVDGAGDEVVVPGSEAAAWVIQELQLARERGVIVRGMIDAEAISPVQIAGDRATVMICSSPDVQVTDVATGEPVSDDLVDTSYRSFTVAYQRIGEDWLVDRADPSEDPECVPASIAEPVRASWDAYAQAWLDLERRGGGPEIGPLAEVITDRFASSLREFPPHDPVENPPPFTDFEVTGADRTSVSGHACRSTHLQTIEWVLVEAEWRIDFVGRTGEEAEPCR